MGDLDGAEREEVAFVAEGGKEGYAKSAAGHGIQERVREGGQKEVEPDGCVICICLIPAAHYCGKCEGQNNGEQYGVHKTAVAESGFIRDAEPHTYCVKIREHAA